MFSQHFYHIDNILLISIARSSHPEVFLGKVLKICSKFAGEHPCRSAISVKLQGKFIEITLWHGCFPVNLLHIFRAPFLKSTSGWLLLHFKSIAQFIYSRNTEKQPPEMFSTKISCSQKFCKFHRKAPVLEFPYNKIAGLKERI